MKIDWTTFAVFLSLTSSVFAAEQPHYGVAAIENGVTHSPVRNQRSEEICWAYTIAGLAEGEYRKAHQNEVVISPEYLGFYHIYHQIESHLAYFKMLQFNLKTDSAHRAEAIDYAYSLLDLKPGKPDPAILAAVKKYFQPDVGSQGNQVLEELELYGMVPVTDLPNATLTTGAQEEKLEKTIPKFVGDFLLGDGADYSKLLDSKGQRIVESDNINTYLYEALGKALKASLGTIPDRPGASFTYVGKTWNSALEFMHEYVGFHSDDWAAFKTSSLPDSALAMKAIAEAADQNFASPIGIVIFGDTSAANGSDVQKTVR
jgi:hypothetical protein